MLPGPCSGCCDQFAELLPAVGLCEFGGSGCAGGLGEFATGDWVRLDELDR